MSVTLSPPTYDALEDLASNVLDRALVLSHYTAGPQQVPYRPCLALVVDDVNELVQFTITVYDTVERLNTELSAGSPDCDVADWYVAQDLRALVVALREGRTSTFQHTWTDGQLVFYWPSVQVMY